MRPIAQQFSEIQSGIVFDSGRCGLSLPPPAPPREKAATCQNQTGQPYADDGTGNSDTAIETDIVHICGVTRGTNALNQKLLDHCRRFNALGILLNVPNATVPD